MADDGKDNMMTNRVSTIEENDTLWKELLQYTGGSCLSACPLQTYILRRSLRARTNADRLRNMAQPQVGVADDGKENMMTNRVSTIQKNDTLRKEVLQYTGG